MFDWNKLHKAAAPLVLIMPKMGGYVETFTIKEGNKNKINKSFCTYDKKLLEKYKTIWTKTEDLKCTSL